MSKPTKLFIPGPVDVSPRVYDAMASAMIGHRSSDYAALQASTQPMLKKLAGTERPVFLSTSSAWGVMEGAIRNLVKKGVLNCCCGAFSDKWFDVAKRCGKKAEAYQVEWGQPIDPEVLREKLATGDFDTVTLVHNETSTGVMNPLKEIAEVVQEFDDVFLVVDSVSSFSAVPFAMDELKIDVLLAGVQKALALPPGLAVCAVSERALERSATVEDRGYYFDFNEFEKNAQNDMTPSTPSIALIYGLKAQLDQIEEEGLANRFARHEATNQLVHDWVTKHGFEFLAPEGFRSKTLTTISNNLEIDVAGFVKALKERHSFLINGGYGKIKGSTFRISNMGNETVETQAELIAALDDVIVDFV